MMRVVFAALALAATAAAAQESKPFAPETQITFLKAQRDMQTLQLKIADLQRQFDQAAAAIKELQGRLEAECATAAKAANVDLTRYNCDLDKLAFVPKPAAPPAPAPATPEKQ
jgi:hypothetical protein